DRYPSVEAYYADKARLFEGADENSRWVLPFGDEEVARIAAGAAGRHHRFGGAAEDDTEAFVDADGWLTLRPEGPAGPPEHLLPAADLPLLGAHNVRNALAAALAARLAGAHPDGIAEGL